MYTLFIFLILFALFFIILLIFITSLIYDKIINKSIIYEINKFPALNYLHDQLKQNHDYLIELSKNIINNKQFKGIKRESGVWVGKKADDFVNSLDDEWIFAWTNDDNWLNYLIIYKNEFMKYIDDPIIKQIFEPVKECINIAGFSLLKPNGIIPTHNDPDTSYKNNRLAYHYNIFGENSKLTINGNTINQEPKTSLIFDSGYYHSVVNGPKDRLLIYVDFDINKAKQYLYGDVIKGLGLASKMGFPTINLEINKFGNGIYKIKNYKCGDGIAFVMNKNISEIHFLNKCDIEDKKLLVKIIKKIDNVGNGIINTFYKGLN